MKIKNYGHTWSFTPKHVASPDTPEALARIVKNAARVRVMGAGHSWSEGIITQDTLVTLDAMNRVLHIDRDQLLVRVQAGIRLMDLIQQLEPHGLTLANLGSIATQSLAGAISTGTHGTGIGFRCLADHVQSLSLIDGQGKIREIGRDHPDFNAVVVGFGAFGVVFEMTLSVVPSFQMHAVTEMMSFQELIDNLDQHVRAHDHFKFWWLVGDDKVIVFRQRRTDEPRNDSDVMRWFKDDVLGVNVYRTLLALQKIERKHMARFSNFIVSRAYGKRFERICKSYVAFLTPEPPVHRKSEWAFDYTNAVELLREYRDMLLSNGHTYNFIQEIRFTAADPFWASPSFERSSIWLSHYNIDQMAQWDDQLRGFLAFARRRDGRPHWGKEAHFDPGYLSAAFPKLGDFAALRSSYDPEDRFANRWIRKALGLPQDR